MLARTNVCIVDPDQTPQNAASDLVQHFLPLIQQFMNESTGNKMDSVKF